MSELDKLAERLRNTYMDQFGPGNPVPWDVISDASKKVWRAVATDAVRYITAPALGEAVH